MWMSTSTIHITGKAILRTEYAIATTHGADNIVGAPCDRANLIRFRGSRTSRFTRNLMRRACGNNAEQCAVMTFSRLGSPSHLPSFPGPVVAPPFDVRIGKC